MPTARRRVLAAVVLAVLLLTGTDLDGDAGPWDDLPAASSTGFVRTDVVVYGGTPAGVAASIAAAEQGARVTLFAERTTVGGLMSNGVSASDVGSPLTVQGLTKRFFSRIRQHYGDAATWRFEPHVAEQVFLRMLQGAGVDVRFRSPVRSATVTDRTIRCARFGAEVGACAGTFIDASYTGDLVAVSGVPNRLGMADFRAYADEQLPRLRTWTELLRVPASEAAAAAEAFEADPFVTVEDELEPYDTAYVRGAPSMTYRLCVTDVPANRTPFRPAADYDALLPSFQVLATSLRPDVTTGSNGTMLSDVFHLAVLPNGKYDLNSGRRGYTNLPAPAGYFDLGADRAALEERMHGYMESFLYFVQHDATVPGELQDVLAPFGLCADEFTDNGGWPREPYVREGRRIEGRYTVTESDVLRNRVKSSSVAVGSYDLDGKSSQVVLADGGLYHDHPVLAAAPTYEIPYEAMLPRAGSVLNLLVPVGVSASPVAFGSIRMEPQWMALGEAAGVAGALAEEGGTSVAGLDVAGVQHVLAARGQLYKAAQICRRTPGEFRAVGGYTPTCRVLPVALRIL